MSYKVKLQSFEGPFDLLVYLIENAQMSIYDIQVSEITSQYLSYLDDMKKMDVTVATEFMVLAAALIEIKSKMILPRTTMEGELIIEDDPRNELVERLLEYKKFKKAAEILQEKEDIMSFVFEKPQEDISAYLDQPDEYLTLDIKKFAAAFDLFLSKRKQVEEVRRHYTRVEKQRETIEGRIEYIKNMFRSVISGAKKVFNFKELIPDKKDRYDTVVSFVSILQMMRDKTVDAEQKSVYGDIIVTQGSESVGGETAQDE
ncbi:MAG: segregation/condensation protein A [Anaerovoracaceae bacterium]